MLAIFDKSSRVWRSVNIHRRCALVSASGCDDRVAVGIEGLHE